MSAPHQPPQYRLDAFNCPLCGAFSKFEWHPFFVQGPSYDLSIQPGDDRSMFWAAQCSRCHKWTMWYALPESRGPKSDIGALMQKNGKMVYPLASQAPLPSNDMPEECLADYNEAREVLAVSPRSAAALLRLCIQKICIHLGEAGRKLDTDIGNLVQKGMSTDVRDAMDIVRVIGNNAVHPGEMDIADSPEIAVRLFDLVNMVVRETITGPRERKELLAKLPSGARDAIERRDGVCHRKS